MLYFFYSLCLLGLCPCFYNMYTKQTHISLNSLCLVALQNILYAMYTWHQCMWIVLQYWCSLKSIKQTQCRLCDIMHDYTQQELTRLETESNSSNNQNKTKTNGRTSNTSIALQKHWRSLNENSSNDNQMFSKIQSNRYAKWQFHTVFHRFIRSLKQAQAHIALSFYALFFGTKMYTHTASYR